MEGVLLNDAENGMEITAEQAAALLEEEAVSAPVVKEGSAEDAAIASAREGTLSSHEIAAAEVIEIVVREASRQEQQATSDLMEEAFADNKSIHSSIGSSTNDILEDIDENGQGDSPNPTQSHSSATNCESKDNVTTCAITTEEESMDVDSAGTSHNNAVDIARSTRARLDSLSVAQLRNIIRMRESMAAVRREREVKTSAAVVDHLHKRFSRLAHHVDNYVQALAGLKERSDTIDGLKPEDMNNLRTLASCYMERQAVAKGERSKQIMSAAQNGTAAPAIRLADSHGVGTSASAVGMQRQTGTGSRSIPPPLRPLPPHSSAWNGVQPLQRPTSSQARAGPAAAPHQPVRINNCSANGNRRSVPVAVGAKRPYSSNCLHSHPPHPSGNRNPPNHQQNTDARMENEAGVASPGVGAFSSFSNNQNTPRISRGNYCCTRQPSPTVTRKSYSSPSSASVAPTKSPPRPLMQNDMARVDDDDLEVVDLAAPLPAISKSKRIKVEVKQFEKRRNSGVSPREVDIPCEALADDSFSPTINVETTFSDFMLGRKITGSVSFQLEEASRLATVQVHLFWYILSDGSGLYHKSRSVEMTAEEARGKKVSTRFVIQFSKDQQIAEDDEIMLVGVITGQGMARKSIEYKFLIGTPVARTPNPPAGNGPRPPPVVANHFQPRRPSLANHSQSHSSRPPSLAMVSSPSKHPCDPLPSTQHRQATPRSRSEIHQQCDIPPNYEEFVPRR